jgi:hypothetical protein
MRRPGHQASLKGVSLSTAGNLFLNQYRLVNILEFFVIIIIKVLIEQNIECLSLLSSKKKKIQTRAKLDLDNVFKLLYLFTSY